MQAGPSRSRDGPENGRRLHDTTSPEMASDDVVHVGLDREYYALVDDVLQGRLAPEDFPAAWDRIKQEKLRAERGEPARARADAPGLPEGTATPDAAAPAGVTSPRSV